MDVWNKIGSRSNILGFSNPVRRDGAAASRPSQNSMTGGMSLRSKVIV
jgi:hypothetical protein